MTAGGMGLVRAEHVRRWPDLCTRHHRRSSAREEARLDEILILDCVGRAPERRMLRGDGTKGLVTHETGEDGGVRDTEHNSVLATHDGAKLDRTVVSEDKLQAVDPKHRCTPESDGTEDVEPRGDADEEIRDGIHRACDRKRRRRKEVGEQRNIKTVDTIRHDREFISSTPRRIEASDEIRMTPTIDDAGPSGSDPAARVLETRSPALTPAEEQ